MTDELIRHDEGFDGDIDGAETAVTPQRRGVNVTPRQAFIAFAVVLGIILVVLILVLLWLLLPSNFTQRGGATQAGLQPIFSIYGPGAGAKPRFDAPMSAAWGKGNRIYVADTKNSRIVVFDQSGRYQFQWGGLGIAKPLQGTKPTWRPGLLDYPTGVATDPDNGDVYVADFYNDSISVFDYKGTFLRRFPDPNLPAGKGSSGANGTGISVTAVAVGNGKVYATDTYQVFVFDKQGNVLQQFGMPGATPSALDHPNGIATDSRGRIYVSDSNHNRVTAFAADGTVLWNAGQKVSGLMKQSDNPFVLPRGLTVLQDGSILVADPIGQDLVKLDENGKIVATLGTRGSDPGQLNFPNDVAARGDLVLVADRENNRVQVVRLTNR